MASLSLSAFSTEQQSHIAYTFCCIQCFKNAAHGRSIYIEGYERILYATTRFFHFLYMLVPHIYYLLQCLSLMDTYSLLIWIIHIYTLFFHLLSFPLSISPPEMREVSRALLLTFPLPEYSYSLMNTRCRWDRWDGITVILGPPPCLSSCCFMASPLPHGCSHNGDISSLQPR